MPKTYGKGFLLYFLNNQKFRGIFFQLLTVVAVVAFMWYIASNVSHNIEQRGIVTGLGFLHHVAGFGIDESPIAYSSSSSTYFDVFLVGLLNTLIVSVVGIIISSVLGLIIGIARLSHNFIISKLALLYVEIFRNIPLLLQILFWYNVVLAALPSPRASLHPIKGIFINNRGLYFPDPVFSSHMIYVFLAFLLAIVGVYFLKKWAKKRFEEEGKEFALVPVSIAIIIIVPLLVFLLDTKAVHFDYPSLHGFNFSGGDVLYPEFLALVLALSIFTATYIAEAVRSAIEAIPKGQKEAAQSLGLSKYQVLSIIILPQAIKIAIPPIINLYLNVVKNSSLATAIGYPEIVTVFAGTVLNQTGQAIEIITITMLVYLFLSLIISLILNFINKKIQIKER